MHAGLGCRAPSVRRKWKLTMWKLTVTLMCYIGLGFRSIRNGKENRDYYNNGLSRDYS